jgi:hypothetical protein
VIAIAVVAYATADMLHEAAHALVGVLSGYSMVSISSVATQSMETSRALAAAGTLANVLIGVTAWLLFRRRPLFDATGYFLWLFGTVSLMNVGYLLISAVLESGDWARVIADLQPGVAWRVGMGLAGLALYVIVMGRAAALIGKPVREGLLSVADLGRLIVPAYVAGGLVMVAAALFNPIDVKLVVTSGVGASFGLTCGLLRIPAMVAGAADPATATAVPPPPRDRRWIAVGVAVAIVFVAVLGPGVRF